MFLISEIHAFILRNRVLTVSLVLVCVSLSAAFAAYCRAMEDRPMVQSSAQAKLPAGEYTVITPLRSGGFDNGTDDDTCLAVLIAGRSGGLAVAALLPQGMTLPSDWRLPDDYYLCVSDDGTWTFKKTAIAEKRIEAMKKIGQKQIPADSADAPNSAQGGTSK